MRMVAKLQEDVSKLQSNYQEKHTVIEQRMKWAVGANPDLNDIFDAYSSGVPSDIFENIFHLARFEPCFSLLENRRKFSLTRCLLGNFRISKTI